MNNTVKNDFFLDFQGKVATVYR